MGDRANVFVPEGFRDLTKTDRLSDRGVYLYGHWSGQALPVQVQEALRRGAGRWDDPSCLTRIIFSDMVRGQEHSVLGFGISTRRPDNEYAILVVDPALQRVSFMQEPASWYDDPNPDAWEDCPSWSFEEFIELSEDELLTSWMEAPWVPPLQADEESA